MEAGTGREALVGCSAAGLVLRASVLCAAACRASRWSGGRRSASRALGTAAVAPTAARPCRTQVGGLTEIRYTVYRLSSGGAARCGAVAAGGCLTCCGLCCGSCCLGVPNRSRAGASLQSRSCQHMTASGPAGCLPAQKALLRPAAWPPPCPARPRPAPPPHAGGYYKYSSGGSPVFLFALGYGTQGQDDAGDVYRFRLAAQLVAAGCSPCKLPQPERHNPAPCPAGWASRARCRCRSRWPWCEGWVHCRPQCIAQRSAQQLQCAARASASSYALRQALRASTAWCPCLAGERIPTCRGCRWG
jgi:hypothetical protein